MSDIGANTLQEDSLNISFFPQSIKRILQHLFQRVHTSLWILSFFSRTFSCTHWSLRCLGVLVCSYQRPSAHQYSNRVEKMQESLGGCIRFMWQGFGMGAGCSYGLCEKRSGTAPMSDRASSRQLQHRPTAAQSCAHQLVVPPQKIFKKV